MTDSTPTLPRWLDRLARVWASLAVLLFLGVGLLWLGLASNRPIREITILSETQYLENRELNSALLSVRGRRFLEADIEAMRQAIAATPWVRLVDIRRVWPDRLVVSIAEHKPIARWREVGGVVGNDTDASAGANDGVGERFVSDEGYVFTAPMRSDNLDKLPLFVGPHHSAPDMLHRYLEMSKYAGQLKQKIVRVDLSPRLAWSFQLAGGMRVELGREHERVTLQRSLQRFVELYQQLRAVRPEAPTVADLRYPNGFVLSYPKALAQTTASSPPTSQSN